MACRLVDRDAEVEVDFVRDQIRHVVPRHCRLLRDLESGRRERCGDELIAANDTTNCNTEQKAGKVYS